MHRFCGCEVRYVEPSRQGKAKWTVHFVWHDNLGGVEPKRGKFKQPMWVQATEFVFLGAGTIGTTEILLRSQSKGVEMSQSVGMNMSSNGDIYAIAYNCDDIANAIGKQDPGYIAKTPVGPYATGLIDMRDETVAPNVRDGFVIVDGTIPEALAPLLQATIKLIPHKIAPKRTFLRRLKAWSQKISSSYRGPWKHGGSVNRTMFSLIVRQADSGEI